LVTGEELLKFSVLIRGILAKGINVTAELAAVLMEEYIGKEVSRRTMQRMMAKRLRGLGAKPHALPLGLTFEKPKAGRVKGLPEVATAIWERNMYLCVSAGATPAARSRLSLAVATTGARQELTARGVRRAKKNKKLKELNSRKKMKEVCWSLVNFNCSLNFRRKMNLQKN
jgi:hypothetical protein